MKFPRREIVEAVRKQYPAGSIVVLDRMEDAQAPKPGTLGLVRGTDDTASIMVSWQGGGSLNVVYGEDRCHLANAEEKALYRLRELAPHQPESRCPRCGETITKTNRLLALSRRLDIKVCEICGTAEAMEAFAGKLTPLADWAAVKEEWE